MSDNTRQTPEARAVADRLEAALGRRPTAIRPLADGGHGARLWRVDIDGDRLVVKLAERHLASEARMLRDLAATGWPVPVVQFSDDGLLVMDWIDHDGAGLSDTGATRFAETLAALHAAPVPVDGEPAFGYRYDAMIGGLPQINERWSSWLDFFRWKRLWTAAWLARRRGRIPEATLRRIEALGLRLGEWLHEPDRPSLIHGDLWAGNVLCRAGRVVAVIDPAISWSHPEIEIAFTALFGGFPEAFYRRYFALLPAPPDFIDRRRDLYNLYPLLVHAALFGGTYSASVMRTLDRYGV